jgi:hypothetical protein
VHVCLRVFFLVGGRADSNDETSRGVVFQEWAHKFVYTDVLQNWIGAWDLEEVVRASPNTVIVHGKERQ